MNPAKNRELILKEKSKYMDFFQKRPLKYRIYETLTYAVVMILLTAFMPAESLMYKIAVVLAAVVIIGAAPWVYGKVLAPEYILKKTQLIIRMRGKERTFALSEVERISEWKALYRLQGKKEALMISKRFLDKLDNQLSKPRKTKRG